MTSGGQFMHYFKIYFLLPIVKSDQHGGRPLLVVAGGNGDSASKKTSEYLDFTLDGPTWKLLSKFFFFFDGEVLLGFSNPGLLLLSLF